MRARNLKPSLFTNELLAVEDPLYTLVFAGLWCLADREGRLEDRPGKIHIAINPGRAFDGTQRALDWLAMHGFISRYSIGQGRYIQVTNFVLHQNPHQKETPSKIPPPGASTGPEPDKPSASTEPAPDKTDASTGLARLIPDSGSLIPDSGSRIPESSRARAREAGPDAEIWSHWIALQDAYPEAASSNWTAAEKAARLRVSDGDSTWDALLDAVRRYAAYCAATGRIVMDPANFFGRSDRPWAQPWTLPKSKAETRLEGNVAVMREFLADGDAA